MVLRPSPPTEKHFFHPPPPKRKFFAQKFRLTASPPPFWKLPSWPPRPFCVYEHRRNSRSFHPSGCYFLAAETLFEFIRPFSLALVRGGAKIVISWNMGSTWLYREVSWALFLPLPKWLYSFARRSHIPPGALVSRTKGVWELRMWGTRRRSRSACICVALVPMWIFYIPSVCKQTFPPRNYFLWCEDKNRIVKKMFLFKKQEMFFFLLKTFFLF